MFLAKALSLLTLCTLGAVSLNGAPIRPPFAWDTVPLYWYSAEPKRDFDDATARYAASHPVIIPNGNHMEYLDPEGAGEESKLIATARRLKSLNQSSSIFFYLNTMMDWPQFDLHKFITKKKPSWWVVNNRSQRVCLNGVPLFNLTLKEVRDTWIGTVDQALKTLQSDGSRLFDGVFADRCNELPKGNHVQPGPGQEAANGYWQVDLDVANLGQCLSPFDRLPPFQYTSKDFQEWNDAHVRLQQDLQARVQNLIVVANNHAVDGVQGRQFERWCVRDGGDIDGKTIVENIEELQRLADNGTVALVHGGEPCDSSALSLSLSAFLVGAGRYSYYSCSDKWLVKDGWNRTMRAKEYDMPLGEPLGKAQVSEVNGIVNYQRRFRSGTYVTLSVEKQAIGEGQGCIFWADAKKSVTGGSSCSSEALLLV